MQKTINDNFIESDINKRKSFNHMFSFLTGFLKISLFGEVYAKDNTYSVTITSHIKK